MADDGTVRVRLEAEIADFVRGWTEAAAAAEAAAARIRAASNDLNGNGAGGGGGNGGGAADELERLRRNAQKAADEIRELGNAARRARGELDDLGSGAGNAGNSAESAGSKVGGMSTRMQVLVAAIVVAIAVLPAIVAGVMALASAAVGVGAAIGVMALGADGLKDAFSKLGTTTQSLQASISAVFRRELLQDITKTGQAINSELKGPMDAVAGSISKLIQGTTEWIRSSEGMNAIKDALAGVKDLVDGIAPAVQGVVKMMVEWGQDVAPYMKEIGAAISYVVDQFRAAFAEAQKSGLLGQVFENGSAAIRAFGDLLKGVLDVLLQMAGQAGAPAAEGIKNLGKALSDAAPVIGQVSKALSTLFDVLMALFDLVARGARIFKDLTTGLDGLKDLPKAVTEPIAGLDAAIKNLSGDATSSVSSFDKLGSGATTAGEKVKGASAAIKDGATQITQTVDGMAQGASKSWVKFSADASAGAKTAMDAATQATTQGGQQFVGQVGQTVGKGKTELDKLKPAAKQAGADAMGALGEGVTSNQQVVLQAYSTAIDATKDAYTDMPKDGEDAGKAAMDGMGQGIQKAVGALVDQATQAAKAVMDAIKKTLGIASPSIVMRDEVGQWIPAGIADGISGNLGVIQDAARLTARAATTSLRGALGGITMRPGAAGLAGVAGTGAGQQVLRVELHTTGSADSLMAQSISKMARTGAIKIKATAVVK